MLKYGVYVKLKGSNMLVIYFGDLLVIGSNTVDIDKLKSLMMTEFEMADLGKLAYFLGKEIEL